MRGTKYMKKIIQDKPSYRKCEGSCGNIFPESELDLNDNKWLCNECEQKEFGNENI